MEKKIYQTPCMSVMQVKENTPLLAGSQTVTVNEDEKIDNGIVDARPSGRLSLWDDED